MREKNTPLGRISLSDEVIATLAGLATTECYGIVGMVSTKIKDGLAELLGRESLSKGVQVYIDADQIEIHLYVVVGYGTRISEIARNVTNKVSYAVESATGYPVSDVRIHVQGVRVGHLK